MQASRLLQRRNTDIRAVNAYNDPSGIAVDATSIYWTNAGTSANNYMDGTIVKLAK
jgi:hypothetical protein